MKNLDKYENKSICQECGGLCCKISGCAYTPSDFPELSMEYIESLLDSGCVSIVADMSFQIQKFNISLNFILLLQARNINRGEIDLLSLTTPCSMLTDKGCAYNLENRPNEGVHLIPEKSHECISDLDIDTEISKWLPYQEILAKIIEKRTGLTVMEKLRSDAYEMYYNLAIDNIKDVHPKALELFYDLQPYYDFFFAMEKEEALKKASQLKRG